MTKLLDICGLTPKVLAGFTKSKNKFYIDYQDKFHNKEIDFGDMRQDRINYSKDFKSAVVDYRKVLLNHVSKT